MQNKDVLKFTMKKREKLKDVCIKQFGRKMNEDVNENRKLFWKEVSNANGGKVENCSRIKDRNGRLALEEVECEGFGRSILRVYII